MKKTITTILLALIFINVYAQAPDWAWAKSIGNVGSDAGRSVASDNTGNVYITGHFDSTITFGTTTLTAIGNYDMFLVKYDPAGNVIWAKSEGGLGGNIAGYYIATDGTGNVYVSGHFTHSTFNYGTTTLVNAGAGGGASTFIVKYNTFGDVIWAKNANGTGSHASTGITTDVFGNIYLIGQFSLSINFGTTSLTSAGGWDMFIVKYDTMGNIIWGKSTLGIGNELGVISCDLLGNVYVIGRYDNSNSITFGTITLTNVTQTDLFIVKYDASGNLLWAKDVGSTGDVSACSIKTDAFNNVYVMGTYKATVTLGSTTLTNAGWFDIFIAKYDALGNAIWAKGIVTDLSNITDISSATDINGNLYVTGIFRSPTIIFGADTLINAGLYDTFFVKYNPQGNVIWAKEIGNTADDYSYSICTDALSNAYVTGRYYSPSITFGTDSFANAGNGDIFIAKIEADILGIKKNTSQNAITIYPNPTSGTFTIQNSSLKLQSCLIKNMFGECVFSLQSNLTNQINIDLSTHAKGIYFVELMDENNRPLNKKLIIE